MPTANKILKNFNLFLDGRSYAGNIEELTLPTLALKGEEYRAGGMDSSIFLEMGQEKMESKFILTGYDTDVLGLWGVGEGAVVPLVARGALESLDGTVEAVTVTMSGTVRSMEPGTWKAGDKSQITFNIDIRAYKYAQAGVVIHEIDILNMIRIVNGVDTLAAMRSAIGI